MSEPHITNNLAKQIADVLKYNTDRLLPFISGGGGIIVNGLQDAGQLEIIENGIYTPPAGSGYTSVNAAVQQAVSKIHFEWSYISGPRTGTTSTTEPVRQKSDGIFRAASYRTTNQNWKFNLYANIPQGQTYKLNTGILLMKSFFSSADRNIIDSSSISGLGQTLFYINNNQWVKINDINAYIESSNINLAGTGQEELYCSFSFASTVNCNNCFFIFNMEAELI